MLYKQRALNILFFQLINDVFGCSHRQREDGPGDIFIRLRNKLSPIHIE